MSETLLSIFADQVQRSPQRAALRYRSGGMWRSRTWREWAETSEAIAHALFAWGIEPGDRIAILSHTRIRWVEADLGIVLAAGATVPIYPTLLDDTIGEILRDSQARLIFAEDPVQLAKVLGSTAGELPHLTRAVVFERVSRLQRPDAAGRLDVEIADVAAERPQVELHTYEEALAIGAAHRQAQPHGLSDRARAVTPDSLAAVYYTSGTSGEPKGVELTHDNFVAETAALRDVMPVGVTDEQLLFLPLAHIMAKLTVMMQLRVGYVTAFADSMEQAAEDCAEVRPTFIVGVPRVYEKIHEAVIASTKVGGDVQKKVFDWALGVGRKVSELRLAGREPSAMLAVQHRSAERLVFGRIKERLGGRVRFMLSGAAPLAKETAEFFHALDLLILEGYGLTESSGASTVNLVHRYRFGSVGMPLPGVEVKLAADGEILLKGRSIMRAYFGREADTREAFTSDGFFRTGDVGAIDADGFLTITDRKKDLIITAGGKNVAPQRVEQRLERSRYIARAVVLGDRRKFPVALIVPDNEAVRRYCSEIGLGELGTLSRHPRVRALIAAEVERVNAGLASFESVKRFELLDGDLTAARGELTPTGKVKRRVIERHYAALIDTLYEGVTADLDEIA